MLVVVTELQFAAGSHDFMITAVASLVGRHGLPAANPSNTPL